MVATAKVREAVATKPAVFPMTMTMNRKIALITGGNRGLGFGTAKSLAEAGYQVVIGSRDAALGEAAAREAGHTITSIELDVSSDKSVMKAFEHIESTYGRLDVLVNNAGAIFAGHPLTVPTSTLVDAFQTNTLGAVRCMQHALPMMNKQGYGRVVNVSSGMGQLSDMGSGYLAYRLSKTALNAATVVLAQEAVANVKVNCICPGWVQTDFGGPSATRTIAEGVYGIVWAATLPEDGPTRGFFRDGKPIAW